MWQSFFDIFSDIAVRMKNKWRTSNYSDFFKTHYFDKKKKLLIGITWTTGIESIDHNSCS